MPKKRGRKPVWPPNVYHHPSGRDRIRVGGVDYWLGPTGSEEARREYARSVLGQKSIGSTNQYGEAVDLTMATEAAKKAG